MARVYTNNVPRHTLYGYELTPRERAEFDYYTDAEMDERSFVRYRRWVYDLSEFERVPAQFSELKGWHGYKSDSFFSGVVIRFPESDCETVIMGTYID